MLSLLLAIVSGALLAFSLPPYDVEWLGWFAVAPLLVGAARRRPLEAVGLGLAAGLVCGGIHVGFPRSAPGVQFAYLPFLWLALLLAAAAAAARVLVSDRRPMGCWPRPTREASPPRSPNGARHHSPGQRPGSREVRSTPSPEGAQQEATGARGLLCRPCMVRVS